MTNYIDPALAAELRQTLSEIFNISSKKIDKNLDLFIKLDPTIRNCLYYLSQIKEDDLKISAALDLEFLATLKKSPLRDL